MPLSRGYKFAAAVGVVLSLVCFAESPYAFATDTFEPNGTIADAYRLYAGPKASYVSTSTDVDYYSVYMWGGTSSRLRSVSRPEKTSTFSL